MYGADAMRYNLLTLCTNNQDVKFDANIDKKTKKLIDSPRTDQAKCLSPRSGTPAASCS